MAWETEAMCTAVVIVATVVGLQDASVDADQFIRIIRSLHEPYKDLALTAEGNSSYVGPYGVFTKPQELEKTYQTVYAFRRDGATFQDAYIKRASNRGVVDRTTAALLKGKLDVWRRTPDAARNDRFSRKGSGTFFFDTGSPSMFCFLWYFAALRDAREMGYECRGWQEIDGHKCLCVRLFLNPTRPDAETDRRPNTTKKARIETKPYELFWIGLGGFDEVEHGQEELTVLGEHRGELLGIESGGTVGKRAELVASRHRWWLLGSSMRVWQPEGTSLQLRAATVFFGSTFHYAGGIINR